MKPTGRTFVVGAFVSLLGTSCNPSAFDGYVLNVPPDGSSLQADGSSHPVDGGAAALGVAVCGDSCPSGYSSQGVAQNTVCSPADCTMLLVNLCALDGAPVTLVNDAPCPTGSHEIVSVANDCEKGMGHAGGTKALCASD